jgi:hypothetical protein
LLVRAGPPVVVLNSYSEGVSGRSVACISSSNSGTATLGARRVLPADAAALNHCFVSALRGWNPALRLTRVNVRHIDAFEHKDSAEAMRTATTVAVVALDHVGVPRGSTGSCLLVGRILRTERGARLPTNASITFSVPCGSRSSRSRERLVVMGELRAGAFSRVYLDRDNAVQHIEPLTRARSGPR